MSCPLNRNRWAGSGYTKPVAQSETAKEMEARMNAMLAERSSQDTKYYPQANELCTSTSTTGTCKPTTQDSKKLR
jgi:hypothetical protein